MKYEVKGPCDRWGSATSLSLQYNYPLTDLPFITTTLFTAQDDPITYLAYKLRKAGTVVLGPYLLAFIHYYCQYKRHKWIKGNPTVLLATETLHSCCCWKYVFRCWKATLYLNQSHIHLYFRLTWHQWNHSPDWKAWVYLLALAKGLVSRYLVTAALLTQAKMVFSKCFRNSHARWK